MPFFLAAGLRSAVKINFVLNYILIFCVFPPNRGFSSPGSGATWPADTPPHQGRYRWCGEQLAGIFSREHSPTGMRCRHTGFLPKLSWPSLKSLSCFSFPLSPHDPQAPAGPFSNHGRLSMVRLCLRDFPCSQPPTKSASPTALKVITPTFSPRTTQLRAPSWWGRHILSRHLSNPAPKDTPPVTHPHPLQPKAASFPFGYDSAYTSAKHLLFQIMVVSYPTRSKESLRSESNYYPLHLDALLCWTN